MIDNIGMSNICFHVFSRVMRLDPRNGILILYHCCGPNGYICPHNMGPVIIPFVIIYHSLCSSVSVDEGILIKVFLRYCVR